MATIWKGAINFGLINVPIKLLSATSKETISFKNLHKSCKTPISQKRWCKHCDEEVAYSDLVKGYEYQKGSFVVISNDELNSIPIKSTKYIQIIDFIKLDEIDPIYFEKPYFLSPEPSGEKPYLILYNAMKKTDTVAVSKITIREKEQLCTIRVYDDILMLNTMLFGTEIKPTAEINMEKIQKKTSVLDMETQMAEQIINNLTAKFDANKYHDEYNSELLKLINAKIDGKEVVQPDIMDFDKSTQSLDLFEKLKASLEATKKPTDSYVNN